jgi:hypothetical protein
MPIFGAKYEPPEELVLAALRVLETGPLTENQLSERLASQESTVTKDRLPKLAELLRFLERRHLVARIAAEPEVMFSLTLDGLRKVGEVPSTEYCLRWALEDIALVLSEPQKEQ